MNDPGSSSTGTAELSRFRCACGRTVVTEHGSEADEEHQCSRCRRRRDTGAEATLRR